MKIENSGSLNILQNVQKIAQANPKKAEEISEKESESGVMRDEYIPSEKDEPIGLYNMEYDENGNPEIRFDDPNKSGKPDEDSKDKSEDKSAGEPESERSESEECTCNTDKVDREIKRLKEKAERLEQQIKSADEEEAARLQKQLESLQSEISQKDNDSYRRSQAVFS